MKNEVSGTHSFNFYYYKNTFSQAVKINVQTAMKFVAQGEYSLSISEQHVYM